QLEETPLIERGFLLPEIQRFSTDFLMEQRTLRPSASINGLLFSHLITFRPFYPLAPNPDNPWLCLLPMFTIAVMGG
ncbi:hypothetical protein, partial [Aeromonas rivipollensis]|uniref:hypothetical protein n=1 Tax=Aeromonas rivipollensis TaxID=948519 RepID=UPI00373AE2F2